MSNGDYDDFLFSDDVGDIVWKNRAVGSSVSTCAFSPEKRIFL
jgi:hypothetical protein